MGMSQDEDRWTPIEMALTQVTEALDDQVKFGLVVFPIRPLWASQTRRCLEPA